MRIGFIGLAQGRLLRLSAVCCTTALPAQAHAPVYLQRRERDRERDRGTDRERERERDRDRERDREKDKDKDREWERDRDKDRERDKRRLRSRSRSPFNDRHRRSASPFDRHGDRPHKSDDRREGRTRERSRDRGWNGSEGERRERGDRKAADKREKGDAVNGLEGQRAAIVAEFVDGIASEQRGEGPPSSMPLVQENDEEVMKKLGIPTGFNSTKGKYVGDANHSAVKLTTKRQPRQYMNRRGGFNRPLPAESNR